MNTPVWKGVHMNNEREHEMNTATKTLLENVLRRHTVNEHANTTAKTSLVKCEHKTGKKAEQSISNRLNIELTRRLADQLARLEAEIGVQIPVDLETRFNSSSTEDGLFEAAKAIRGALLAVL